MDVIFKILPWLLGAAAVIAVICIGYVKAPPDTDRKSVV